MRSTGDHSRSAAAWTMFIGWRLIITSIGASGEVITSSEEEPRCMQITVPSSEHAVQNGSQWSLCSEGQPSLAGFSEKVTAWQPRSAIRCTSAAASSGSHSTGIESGMNRPGSAPHQPSRCQSL